VDMAKYSLKGAVEKDEIEGKDSLLEKRAHLLVEHAPRRLAEGEKLEKSEQNGLPCEQNE